MKTDIAESMKTLFKEMGNDYEKCADDRDGPSGCLRERFLAGGSCGGRSYTVEHKKP
ncbi:hypothetical protein F2Q68_00019246 [Brassica cretica]|uniref:Uncharacterized protein n=1 Tax=Brassica cretica TaxID=69181 RepID=A0A8S9FU19_BRACR|nr:hypothetical protein F2Q68_00019246 [Brassica cretica]